MSHLPPLTPCSLHLCNLMQPLVWCIVILSCKPSLTNITARVCETSPPLLWNQVLHLTLPRQLSRSCEHQHNRPRLIIVHHWMMMTWPFSHSPWCCQLRTPLPQSRRYINPSYPINLLTCTKSLGSGDDHLQLGHLKHNELLEWIQDHNIKPSGKQASKKGMALHLSIYIQATYNL